MKILIYSDLHISKTSSILPALEGKYSFRQNMIIKTGEYIKSLITEHNPDLIINLGDTFDQHTITSYDVDTASCFFNCFKDFNIPHYVLVGNHEMVNNDFNAVSILNNIDNITVIKQNQSIEIENSKLAFLPYCRYENILEFPEGDYLFAHQDIQGSVIRGDFKLPEGIEPSDLKNHYKLVFNGHIHKASIMDNIINVGSVTTHSFSDDNEGVPQCYLFDTETLNLQTFKPRICPLFRKIEVNNVEELDGYVKALDKNYKYILHIVCPYNFKQSILDYINSNNDIIINSRINTIVDKEEKFQESSEINLKSNVDIKQTFKDFLNQTELKYPINYYEQILKEIN